MSKKVETSIHIANGGNHSPVNYRKAKQMLLSHPYSLGLLYHIVLTGSEDRNTYRKAVELLCKELRKNGMPCRYKACYERDKFKRFHMHMFILIEAIDYHPDTIIHYRVGHWFTEMTKGLGLAFKIAQPKDPMHYVAGKQVNYAYVPKKASPKLEDCLIWISYLTKVRSKAGVDGQIYTGSTNRESPILPSAALPAAEEAVIWNAQQTNIEGNEIEEDIATPLQASNSGSSTSTEAASSPEALVCPRQWTSTSEEASSQPEASPSPANERHSAGRACPSGKGFEVNLTPAQRFLAPLYERCVDADLDVDQIRRYLLDKGIRKTPYQVANDLDNIFQFTGYSASHQPMPVMSVQDYDRAIDRA